ncbi:hypothetical protein EON80_28130 [bacterium]|nr:MAG: hypothetical protein EON80_28130 [bacterium]
MTRISFLLPALLLCSIAHADVASVRRRVANIDSMKLSSKTYNRADLSSEGAEISVWRDAKGAPRKVVARIYGEMGQVHDTIYLEKGLPLFLFTIDESYDGPLSLSVKVAKRQETRLYFDNGKLFLKREGTKTVPLTSAQKQAGNKLARHTIELYLVPGK